MKPHFLKYLTEDIWVSSDRQKSVTHDLSTRTLKTFLLSVQGFNKDDCSLRASALTLYTLLSIVPVIALLFGIAKGFGFEKKLEQQLLEQATDQDVMMLQLIELSQNMLATTKGGIVAGIGIIVLFWTIIKVIGNIEESFNHIWKIKKNRPFARKLSDYLSLMMLAPVLLITSSSMTVFVKTKITWLVTVIHLPTLGTKLVLYAMSFSPLLIMSVLFSFIFIFMPNQKINVKAGVIAGIITGVLYQIVQTIYLNLQIGVSSYNAIYGSFAALPLFLVWLQIGWIVVLFGCEISFYIHNFESYRHNKKFSNLSFSLKQNITIQVYHLIVKHFVNEEKAPHAEFIANELALPISIVQTILEALIECRLAVKLDKDEDEEDIYQPAKDISTLTIAKVKHILETSGKNFVPGKDEGKQFLKISQLEDSCLIKDI